MLSDTELNGQRDLWLRATLPQYRGPAHFMLSTSASGLIVYVDREEVYAFGDVSGNRSEPLARPGWHTVELPPGGSGAPITLFVPRALAGTIALRNAVIVLPGGFPSFALRYIRQPVAAELDQVLMGGILSGIGIFALALFLVRRTRGQLALLLFGTFSLLYGVRMLINTGTIRQSFDIAADSWAYANAFITYFVPLPLLLFLRQFLTPRWKRLILWLVLLGIGFAMVATMSDVIQRRPGTGMIVNDVLVVLSFVLLIPALAQRGDEPARTFWTLRGGLLVFLVFAVNENLVSLGLVPWQFRREPIGFFVFVCCLGYVAAQRFFENERHLAELGKEMETARQIQTSILPRRLPGTRGVETAVRYQPMTAVAGDFYDFHAVDGSRLGVLIADVSGHGVPAALIASMLKVAFASNSAHAGDPAALLASLNGAFCGQLDSSFITASYVFLDVQSRTLLHASAAHPPVLVWRAATQTVDALGESGLMLGPFPRSCYSNTAVNLLSGDRLVLYTDGLIEASKPSGDAYGDERLRQFVRTNASLPASRFADQLLAEVAAWCGRVRSGQEDDITLLVLDIA